jgi:alginate O-acetyltransferase complex protein AlgI
MIYSNYEFLLLLPAFLVWYYSARTLLAQKLVILAGSMAFLAWTGIWHLAVAAAVIGVAFAFLAANYRWRVGRAGLAVVIVVLIGNLAYFKYRGFLASSFGISLPAPSVIAWLLPLGISFYTFEAISAVIDLNRRRTAVEPLNWSLFIMFFPHLIAGPIVRYRQLVPQFTAAKVLNSRNLQIGLHFFVIGFLKKLAADPLGHIIEPVWASPSQATAGALVLALLGFYVQVYLDFSGYTDMGRGIARMMGYRLPLNFRAPFLAASPGEFFQRWHVSLSSWIRTFVYDTLAIAMMRRIPNRRIQPYALMIVILIVMALFGLWHGAAWHFVLFGIALGLMIVGWTAVTKGRPPKTVAGLLCSIVLLQLAWIVSLVLFRADNLTAVGQFYAGLFRFGPLNYADLRWSLVALAATFVVQGIDYSVRRRPVASMLIALRSTRAGALVVLALFAFGLALKVHSDDNRLASLSDRTTLPTTGFIYFRF